MSDLQLISLEAFQAAVAALGGTAPAAAHQRLLHAWEEPHRRYHTQQHLAECLARLHAWGQDLPDHDRALLTLSLWYHDAVYSIFRKDSEQLSAELARRDLCSFGVAAPAVGAVVELVLLTEHAAELRPGNELGALMLDIDLSILGASPARFQEYEQQIREEYQAVGHEAFNAGRRRVLEAFYAKADALAPTLYLTEHGRSLLPQARANLASALGIAVN